MAKWEKNANIYLQGECDKVSIFNTLIPDLLTSAKSVWDISGKSITKLNYNLHGLDDNKAMIQDWKMVGDDMKIAFRCMDDEIFYNPELQE